MEEYITFSVGNLRFIDSFQFMSASLHTLVKNLKDGGKDNFKIMTAAFEPHKVDLLLRKGLPI